MLKLRFLHLVAHCPSVMSAASSLDLTHRLEAWHQLRQDLAAEGLPAEVFPQRLPRCYHSYGIRGPGPERNVINVLAARRAFLVPSQVTGESRSTILGWGGDPVAAWRQAKALARW